MFRLMRNVHLALGVGFFFVALLFAFSSSSFIAVVPEQFGTNPCHSSPAMPWTRARRRLR